MKRYGDQKAEHPKRELRVQAQVIDNAFMMRLAGATAKLPDGSKVEVSASMDQATLIVTLSPGDDSWRSFIIDPAAIVSAVLASEASSAPQPAQQCAHPDCSSTDLHDEFCAAHCECGTEGHVHAPPQ